MSLTQTARLESKSFSAHGESSELTIGDLAREFSVSLRTLRFYEDRGLLRPRREGTSRYYSAMDKVRLQLILKGKQLGFTLAEIRELLGAGDVAPGKGFEERLRSDQIISQISHLERQRGEIDQAIHNLRATHSQLEDALTV
jgi:DNA-binding transcriptional MerR regulator